jgi:hypothetical protein
VRALSRAVAVLRTNIVDSGLGMAVFQIFKKDADEDRRVTAAALAAVCNIVNEFSPLRPVSGGLTDGCSELECSLPERLLSILQPLLDFLLPNLLLFLANSDCRRYILTLA